MDEQMSAPCSDAYHDELSAPADTQISAHTPDHESSEMWTSKGRVMMEKQTLASG